jgi:hypothetical protein
LKRELPQEDAQRCVAWLDGELDGAERERFELRLAAEPDLAAAAEELLETDELMRRLDLRARAIAERRARLRPWLWAGSIAAAAALLVWVAASLLAPRPARVRVAVLPSFESATEFVASMPELQGLRPPGLDVQRGAGEAPNVGAAEFAARAESVEAALARRAIETSQTDARAGYFSIPLDLERRSLVRVWAFPQAGDPIALFPGDSSEGSLAAGPHMLPGARFRVAEGGEPYVVYERGYLVPIGARALDVVVAVRPWAAWAVDSRTVERASTADETQRALERAGWSVTRLVVREP